MKLIFLFISLSSCLLTYAQDNESYYKVGDLSPDFSGRDQYGNQLQLSKLLNKGPVLLFFYRGYWCPHCSRQLSELQDSLDLITARGVSVVAVTPESHESIEKTINNTGASFHIIFDENHIIIEQFKLSFELKGPKKTIYKIGGINLENINGEEDNILPVPATYLIGRDGRIKYLFYDVDYSKRAKIKDILQNL